MTIHSDTGRQTSTPRGRRHDRRRFLQGVGACVALPAFESLLPRSVQAAEATTAKATASTTPGGAPLRTAFVYFPNGAQQDNWFPSGAGHEFSLNKTMQPLEGLKSQIQVIGGLDHINATPGPDGAGDHARANATFLTGVRARKTAGADIHLGVSIDQLAADKIGAATRFPSLELSCDAVRKSGGCDSGYSCAYQFNLSWRTPTTPMTPEPNPRLVFERLFGGTQEGEGSLAARRQRRQSVLDFVLEDSRSLERNLAPKDRRKLDEYLTGVREVEQRIARAENFADAPRPDMEAPEGIPADYGEHMNLMFDMLALAFQTDSTRVATLLLAGDGTNRAFPQIDIPEGHHYLTHQRDAEKQAKVAEIDLYYMQRFARFLDKLANTEDADGHSVLHNSMIVYGCGIADGNRHTHENLPVILAGAGGGTLETGRYVQVPPQPMTNLFLSMLDRLGVEGVQRFGDSTGRLKGI